ncbi:MAG: hydrogenase maturation factor [Lachnospiraceae bacterium]|nr:hydrogenase maturation factor [Lachnospiraceae bacterium]
MKPGKVSENILKRSVFKNIEGKSAFVGADCAFLSLPECTVVAVGYVANEPVNLHGKTASYHGPAGHAIIRAVNDLSAGGAKPAFCTLSVSIPEDHREIRLKTMIQDASEVAKEMGISIVGGHTETVPGLVHPIVSATVMGSPIADHHPEKVIPGDSIVMTKWAALSGTAMLAGMYREELLSRLPDWLIDDAEYMEKLLSIVPEAAVAVKAGAVCMHDLSDGGVFAALWQLAERDGVGLEVELKAIPIHQESVEVCEFFDISPYKLRSDGSLLIVTRKPEELIDLLEKENIQGTLIGHITEGRDRIIIAGEEKRFLDEPRQDEVYMI